MQFKDVIGQALLKKELPELMQQNRLAHALIFLGKEGSGALAMALAFAQFLVCEKVNGNNEPAGPSLFGDAEPAMERIALTDSCGVCAACQKARQFIHPDIHFSYPVVTKKAGTPPISTDYITEWRGFLEKTAYGNVYDWLQFIDAEKKQGNITASECNDIIRKLNLKSFESEYKILIMWMPEYLGTEGNRLLKLIEEPPKNTLFILVAENESMILSTILSRCQLINIPQPEFLEVEHALIDKYQADASMARQLTGVSDGNIREAVMMLQHAGEDWQHLLREWLNAILKNGPSAQAKWVEEVSALGREKQKQFLRYFTHLIEQAIRLEILSAENMPYLGNEEKDFLARLNKITSLEQQEAIINELDNAAYFIERNANGKMLFMALTLKIYHIIRNKVVFLN